VGQPDGGRDAFDSETKTVMQVKFKKSDEDDSADWMISALTGELEKINKLIERGITRYIMVTNARGTAHLDSGKIDKVQQWMQDNISIPSTCYWRDEMDRRLDKSPTSLRLKYSEILTLEDGMDVVLSEVFDSRNDRRNKAVRLFILKQYEDDENIKFRQLDLSNQLLSLFIDIPINFPKAIGRAENDSISEKLSSEYSYNLHRDGFVRDPDSGAGRSDLLGAGKFLLGFTAQERIKYIVLEGAPGQGKSTLAQFICQVHRARYLGRTKLLEQVPEGYLKSTFRLPIKVDLRDFAKFLEDRSPFEPGQPPSRRTKSMEGFLGELVQYCSGGIDLDAYEVQEILRAAPVLLFLDGLDEVADLRLRRRLVSLIGDTLIRLEELGADLQVVVTSRPSVFGKVTKFKKFGFVTAVLGNIDERRVFEYAEKWMIARRLASSEQAEISEILREKLEHAHIRDLTRNPMQLTILLTLIRQVGYSLPDQRTDLYQKYLDLFFIREAEKSRDVHDNRDMLVGFIEFLAWHLHSQAEAHRSAGSVSREELTDLARSYLAGQGVHDDVLADTLFGGGLERIYVLVERIEGLYEFEVQPLREYFCAHYLYTTAPTITHRESSVNGDRAQRFEAIAANPFWLNVTRFYAGMYVRGELGGLVTSLRELISSSDLALSIHARRVGLALLQDRVFTNKRFCQEEVIKSVFDDLGLIAFSFGSEEIIELQPECGQATLRQILFEFMQKTDFGQRRFGYNLQANGGRYLCDTYVQILEGLSGVDRTRQLRVMFASGAISFADPKDVPALVTEDSPDDSVLTRRLGALHNSNPSVISESIELSRWYVDGILDGLSTVPPLFTNLAEPISIFAGLFASIPYARYRMRRRILMEERMMNREYFDTVAGSPDNIAREKVIAFLELLFSDLERENVFGAYQRKGSFRLEESLIEAGASVFGERWLLRSLAVQAAGTKPDRKIGSNLALFEKTASICERARSARMSRSGPDWWSVQASGARSACDKMFWCALVLLWTSVQNLLSLSDLVNEFIESLSADQERALRKTLLLSVSESNYRRDRTKLRPIDLSAFSDRAAVLVAISFGADLRDYRYLPSLVESSSFQSWKRWREEYEYLRNAAFPRTDAEAIDLFGRTTELQGGDYPLPPKSEDRMYTYEVSRELAGRIMEKPIGAPPVLVQTSLGVIDGSYQPEALDAIVIRENWSFE
jgi:hypothetical protein